MTKTKPKRKREVAGNPAHAWSLTLPRDQITFLDRKAQQLSLRRADVVRLIIYKEMEDPRL